MPGSEGGYAMIEGQHQAIACMLVSRWLWVQVQIAHRIGQMAYLVIALHKN